MIRRAIVAGALLMLNLEIATAQPVPAFDPVATVHQRFDAIAALLPAPKLNISDQQQKDGLVTNSRVNLSIASIRAAKTAEELDGMLAFLIAQTQSEVGYKDKDTSQPLSSVLAAGAVIAIGEKIDPIDTANAPRDAQRNYVWTPREPPAPAGTERGRAALTLMQRAGTCSGAALALMVRLASPRDYVNDPPVRYLAQQARQQFGSLAAPPDDSCISR